MSNVKLLKLGLLALDRWICNMGWQSQEQTLTQILVCSQSFVIARGGSRSFENTLQVAIELPVENSLKGGLNHFESLEILL